MLIQPSKYSEFESIEKESKIGEGTYAVVYTGIAKKPREKPIKVALKRIKPGQYQEGLDISAIREIK
jgi:cyclin-dependent kinase 7